jgi:hypothetical protein
MILFLNLAANFIYYIQQMLVKLINQMNIMSEDFFTLFRLLTLHFLTGQVSENIEGLDL